MKREPFGENSETTRALREELRRVRRLVEERSLEEALQALLALEAGFEEPAHREGADTDRVVVSAEASGQLQSQAAQTEALPEAPPPEAPDPVSPVLPAREGADRLPALENPWSAPGRAEGASESPFDDLTGVFNLRYYEEQLQREYARARRYQRALTLVFLSIDHLQKFFSTYGHFAGNALLKQVAELIRAEIRRADFVLPATSTPFAARHNGKAFILVLPETGLEGGRIVAERIRARISDTQFTGPKGPVGLVTMSGGVGTLSEADQSCEVLVRRVDDALMRARAGGYDRIELALPALPQGGDYSR